MSFPFRKALDEEIRRLTAAKERANRKKQEVIERIDRHVALLDERIRTALQLAEVMDRRYPKLSLEQRFPLANPESEDETPNVESLQTALASFQSSSEHSTAAVPDRAAALTKVSELTLADVEATDLPEIASGRRLRPNSKRAEIIRATMALLKKQGSATREQILQALQRLGILSDDEQSVIRLKVILTEAKEVFGNYRRQGMGTSGWYLVGEQPEEVNRRDNC